MDKRKEANLHVKNSITDALIALMNEKSFEAISVSEITNRARVSRVSYYRNFNSKEDILTGILDDLMSRFTENINTVPKHTPTRRVMTVFFIRPGKMPPFLSFSIRLVWTATFRTAWTSSSFPAPIFHRWTVAGPIRPICFPEPCFAYSFAGMTAV